MLINDQILSAFLDDELSADEAEQVRDYIAEHDEAAARLAQLAMTDQRVRAYVDDLSATPMPRKVLALLDDDAANKVIPLHSNRGFKGIVQQHLAAAASVALMVGFGFGYAWQSQPTSSLQPRIAEVLEQQSSGTSYTIADGKQLLPQLTFTNSDGEFCRQYQLQDEQQQTAEVAIQCRRGEQWQLVAMAEVAYTQSTEYRTASASHALDSVLDQMMSAAPLSAEQERAQLRSAWQLTPNRTQTEEH
jgi:hypothetical protein